MQAIDIFLFFSSFFFYSCALALLLNWLWIAAGSPSIDENETQASAHRNKIFSFFGVWVAQKFNEYEARKKAELPAQIRAQIERLNPHEARQILSDFIGKEQVEMMPIESIKENLYPIFLEQYPPLWLNPYSVLGLCLPCTSFWVGLLGWLPLWFCPFVGFWTLLGAFFFLPSTIFQIAKIART
jgi:hypothetical protein